MKNIKVSKHIYILLFNIERYWKWINSRSRGLCWWVKSVKGEFITSQHGQRTAARVQRLQNISDPNSLTEEFRFADLFHDSWCWMMQCVLGCVRMSKGLVPAFICEVKQCEHRVFVFAPALLPDGRVHSRGCGGLPALSAVKHSSAALFEGPACRQRNQAEVF